jgi:hypothetical protein
MLRCTSVGSDAYQWQVNGTDLDNETLSILRIPNITADHGGEYTCVVTNYLGSHNDSTFLFVYPYFRSQPPGDLEVPLGTGILLICDAMAFPYTELEYVWIRVVDGSDSRVIDGRILNITNAQLEDEGSEYYCIVTAKGKMLRSQSSIMSGMDMDRMTAGIMLPVYMESI